MNAMLRHPRPRRGLAPGEVIAHEGPMDETPEERQVRGETLLSRLIAECDAMPDGREGTSGYYALTSNHAVIQREQLTPDRVKEARSKLIAFIREHPAGTSGGYSPISRADAYTERSARVGEFMVSLVRPRDASDETLLMLNRVDLFPGAADDLGEEAAAAG